MISQAEKDAVKYIAIKSRLQDFISVQKEQKSRLFDLIETCKGTDWEAETFTGSEISAGNYLLHAFSDMVQSLESLEDSLREMEG